MITENDREFINMLFGKLTKHVDMDMVDLSDSDCCDDHLQWTQLELPTD